MEKLESRLNGKIGALESQIGELRERMAHLEGFLEGLREAITGRAAAGLGDEKAMQSKRGGGPRQAFRREGALLHDSTAARVGALFQLLVQDTTAQDFGLPSSAIRLRM